MRAFIATVLAALLVAALPGTAAAGSIDSLYDMNRMLSEPHPLAHQYGTRWRPAPVQPRYPPPEPFPPKAKPMAKPMAQPATQPAAQPSPAPAVQRAPAAQPAAPLRTATRPAPRAASGDGLGGVFSEIRIGALAHDMGPFSSNKEDGVDTQVELRFVSPEFLKWIWSPNPHIGGNINSSGATSSVWLGLVWEREVWKKLFVGWSMGGAYHTGETDQGTAALDEKELGCNPLFRLALNVGWRFDEHHSVDAILDHISNAKICDTNEGLENVGIRYGYKF